MTARRAALAKLLAVEPEADLAAPGAEAPHSTPSAAARPERAPAGSARTGSVRAMGLELERLARSRSEGGEGGVVEIDAAACDPSPVRDRLERVDSCQSEGEPEARGDAPGDPLAGLAASIAADGQVVPVLLRPHEAQAGRYRIVYGHRRVAACRRLGRPVRALVREIDAGPALLMQGQENAERRDLTFIERALFAAALSEAGLDRAELCAALAVHPSEAARLLAVGRGVPRALAARIGRAPSLGRPRWMRLAKAVEAVIDEAAGTHGGADAATHAATHAVSGLAPALAAIDALPAGADGAARLAAALAALEPPPRKLTAVNRPPERAVLAEDGTPLARLGPRSAPLALTREAGPDFAAYLARRLPDLHEAWLRTRD